jgi:hypothetical protein
MKKQPLAELLDFGDLTLGHSFYYHSKNTESGVSPATFCENFVMKFNSPYFLSGIVHGWGNSDRIDS